MSFIRFLTWLIAFALAAGGSLVLVRYGLGESNWGEDGVWTLFGSVLFTRQVQEALEDMWSRFGAEEGETDG
jgi:hypothetical protein